MQRQKNSADGGFYNAAVNRLYYACYYAATALLVHAGLSTATHKGVKTQLNLHFVLNGLIPKDMAKTFSILFESRQSGDYADFVFYDEEDYCLLLPKSEEFINCISLYIKNNPLA